MSPVCHSLAISEIIAPSVRHHATGRMEERKGRRGFQDDSMAARARISAHIGEMMQSKVLTLSLTWALSRAEHHWSGSDPADEGMRLGIVRAAQSQQDLAMADASGFLIQE